jgi:hypothetical protein
MAATANVITGEYTAPGGEVSTSSVVKTTTARTGLRRLQGL